MKLYLVAAAAALTLGAYAERAAAQGVYVALRVVPSLSNGAGIKTSPPSDIGLINDEIEFVAAAGAAVGYDWRPGFDVPLRTEIEYRYRYHFDLDSRRSDPDVVYDTSVRDGHTLTVNAWAPYAVTDSLEVMAGAGVGVVFKEADVTRRQSGARQDRRESAAYAIWRVGVGARYLLTDSWSIEALYQYADLGELKLGPFAGGDSVSFDRTYSHDFSIGVAYQF